MKLSFYYFNFILSVTAFFPIWLGPELFKEEILIIASLIYILIILISFFLLNYALKKKNYFLQLNIIFNNFFFI